MKKPNSPCLNCQNRNPGCHSRCEAYKKFRRDNDEYTEMLFSSKKKNDDYMMARYKNPKKKRMFERYDRAAILKRTGKKR